MPMKSKILAACLAAALALPAVALADQPAAKPTVTAEPGKGIRRPAPSRVAPRSRRSMPRPASCR